MSGARPFQDNPALRVDGLAVARGGRVLFAGLSFLAEAGDYVELRGANGSGKTSLIRALAGFLPPRAGTIVFERIEEPALAIHYVGHTNGLKTNASVASHARYWAGLFGVAEAEDALARVGLSRARDRLARTLSQGQARRLALSRLVIAPRPIWLLDEPAAALDADGRETLGALVAAHRADGGIVVAAVHEPLGPEPSLALTVGA
jgi:heme exporter protein A